MRPPLKSHPRFRQLLAPYHRHLRCNFFLFPLPLIVAPSFIRILPLHDYCVFLLQFMYFLILFATVVCAFAPRAYLLLSYSRPVLDGAEILRCKAKAIFMIMTALASTLSVCNYFAFSLANVYICCHDIQICHSLTLPIHNDMAIFNLKVYEKSRRISATFSLCNVGKNQDTQGYLICVRDNIRAWIWEEWKIWNARRSQPRLTLPLTLCVFVCADHEWQKMALKNDEELIRLLDGYLLHLSFLCLPWSAFLSQPPLPEHAPSIFSVV